MNNVIDLEERRRIRTDKGNVQEIKKSTVVDDLYEIAHLVSIGEVKEIDIILNHAGKDYYYGFRENIEKCDIVNRIELLDTIMEFK